MTNKNIIHNNYKEKYFNISYTITHNPLTPKEHIHNSYEIYYFLSGNVTYFIEGHAYNVDSNDLLLINNKEVHKPVFNSNQMYKRYVIHFNPSFLSSFQTGDTNLLYCFEQRKMGYYNLINKNYVFQYDLKTYFDKIIKFAKLGTPEDVLLAKTYFIQLLLQLNKIFKQNKDTLISNFTHDEKINTIINYINDNICNQLSLDLLQNIFFVNKYYLCHIFKRNTGFTVLEYITYKRIILAKELLSEGFNATEVCSKIGYNDYSNFYRTFKKLVGMTPKNFQKSTVKI